MDVISIYSSGIKNVVSNSGIALTENQINLIWKFFSYPIVCLDGDISGQKAALRIAENLLQYIKENNKIGFVSMSKGCLLYTSPSPRDKRQSRMPSSA